MCNFFSLVSDGKGNPLYFDAKIRKEILSGKLNYELDSHTSIADYFGHKGADEDKLNKYEYNPLTKVFTIDQTNTTDDSGSIEKFCKKLDFKTIVPELIIKPIVHPFKLKRKRVTEEDIELLRQWASVRASVGTSVWDSVWASVRASVGDSVGDSVRASVGDSVRASVGASVGDSVWASVGDSVRAYTSSFFQLDKWKYIKHPKGQNPYQPCIDLWEKGLVPSFDGKIWRLHGENGRILKEIKL